MVTLKIIICIARLTCLESNYPKKLTSVVYFQKQNQWYAMVNFQLFHRFVHFWNHFLSWYHFFRFLGSIIWLISYNAYLPAVRWWFFCAFMNGECSCFACTDHIPKQWCAYQVLSSQQHVLNNKNKQHYQTTILMYCDPNSTF